MIRMIKKKKVAILSWACAYQEHEGGKCTHIAKLAAMLAKDGYDIHIFTRRGKEKHTSRKKEGLNYHYIQIDQTLPLMKGISLFAKKIYERIKRIESKEKPFDIIHCYNWHPARAITSLQNGRQRRVIFTLSTNDVLRESAPDNDVTREQKKWEQELIKISDKIVCFDDEMRRELKERFFLPDAKISHIQQEFDWESYQGVKDPGEVKKKYDLWPLDPLVLFVGEFSRDFGPDILAEAIPSLLKKNPQLRFLLVGDGELMWPIRIKARYLSFEHAIRLVGHKEGRELQELFQGADIVVIPNRISTTPYQVLAAWSAKKPVVATREGGYGIIRHLENGLSIYDNADSIVWGIERILSDWNKGYEMAQKGWEHLHENYTLGAIGKRIEGIYQAVATKI